MNVPFWGRVREIKAGGPTWPLLEMVRILQYGPSRDRLNRNLGGTLIAGF